MHSFDLSCTRPSCWFGQLGYVLDLFDLIEFIYVQMYL